MTGARMKIILTLYLMAVLNARPRVASFKKKVDLALPITTESARQKERSHLLP